MKRMKLENIRVAFICCVAQFNKLRASRVALEKCQIFKFIIGSKLFREFN